MPLEAKCFRCDKPAERHCGICSNAMCGDHSSVDDPDFCLECVSPENTRINSEPLIDKEGIEHTGRHITIEGDGWLSSIGIIARLTDDELPRWIEKHGRLLREAEQRRDYNRIMLGALQMESEDRRIAGIKFAREIGRQMPTQRVISGTALPSKQPRKQVSLVDKLKAAGVTKEMLESILAVALGKAK